MTEDLPPRFAAVITLSYESKEEALSVLGAVDVDNKGYVEAEHRGSNLYFRTKCNESGMLRNTLDDLLSCVGIAERMIGFKGDFREHGGTGDEKKK